jgi:hypothetical protein
MEKVSYFRPGFGPDSELDPNSPKILDPDPHIMNADPKHWYYLNFVKLSKLSAVIKKFVVD